MATVSGPEQYLLLNDVDWAKYDRLLREFDGQHLRFTFDQGTLEIMALSAEHERFKKLLARLFEALTEELGIPVLSVGSTTCRSEGVERGLEPDEGWYIEHEAEMRRRTEIDLDVDPPPDLALEVEITRSALGRMAIYAALRVPQVWRFNGKSLRVHVLNKRGRYIEKDRSPTFPLLPISVLERFLRKRSQVDETTLIKEFRQWVRENLVQRPSVE